MARRCIVILLVGVLLFFGAATSWASKAFVTDSFRISLRRGPSIENKILRFIPSGLPVEVFETQDGWSRVRVLGEEQGVLEGWVLSRYLIRRLPWEDQVQALTEENAALKEKLAVIDDQWEETLRREKDSNSALRKDYEVTRERALQLAEENEILRASKRKKWFTAGGLVLFSGLLVGLLVGKPPKRRRLSF